MEVRTHTSGLGIWLSWLRACLACTKFWVWSPVLHKLIKRLLILLSMSVRSFPRRIVWGEKALPDSGPSWGSPDIRWSKGRAGLLQGLLFHLAGKCVHVAAHCCCYCPLLTLKPRFFSLLAWTEDQELSRTLPGLQHQTGSAETASLGTVMEFLSFFSK